jgi:hypothetical protein
MAVEIGDIEVDSFNSTQEELDHAVSSDWRTALAVAGGKQEEESTTEAETTEGKTEPTEKEKPATQAKPVEQQTTKPATETPKVPRKHLESRLKTEEAARARAVADNVRLTARLAELERNGGRAEPAVPKPTAAAQPVVEAPKFVPSKPEPQLNEFSDYEKYDKAWRQWTIQRGEEHAQWLLENQAKKLPETIKATTQELTAKQQQEAEQAEQVARSNDLKLKLENARTLDPEFNRVLEAPIVPPDNQPKLKGAMWAALMETPNAIDVMKYMAENQEDWNAAMGKDESGKFTITPNRLQHVIYQISEHLEDAAETETPANGAASKTPAPKVTTPQPTTTNQPRTPAVPMPVSSAPAPSASTALRGGARTVAKALNDDSAWDKDDASDWIAKRNEQIRSNRIPRGFGRR